jgi:hypothetical protein
MLTVDGNGAERRHVYLQRSIGYAVPGIAVTTAANGDGNGLLARELHAASHIIYANGAYHRKWAAIVSKIPNPPRLVVTRRIPSQESPANAAGEIIEFRSRMDGGERGGQARVSTESHGTRCGASEIAPVQSGEISFAHAH